MALPQEKYQQMDKQEQENYLIQTLDNNLKDMTEQELKDFDRRYKDFYLPNHRLYSVIPFNIVVGGFAFWYTINIKTISQKFFKPKKYGFKDLLFYGTLQSVIFVSGYTLGMMAVTGLWDPVQYARNLAKIQGTIVDTTIRHDKQAQKYLLYNFMEYFGLSEDILKTVQENLDKQKKELMDKQYFTKETIKIMKEKNGDIDDDDDDDEEEEN